MRKITIIVLLIILLFALIALEGSVPGLTYRGASPLNRSWDGSSHMVELLSAMSDKVVIVKDWGALDESSVGAEDGDCKAIIIVSPEKPYTDVELSTIRKLVLSENFRLILLDEGGFGNQVLEALKVPVEIEEYSYLTSGNGSYTVWGVVEVYGSSLNLAFAYVAPVKVRSEELCRYVGYVNSTPIGALCELGATSILVIGDGSIVTNSALTPLSEYNPYVMFLDNVVNEVCRSVSATRRKVFLIDASKYYARILTPLEIMASDSPLGEKLRVLLNPARYIYQLVTIIEESSGSLSLYFAVLVAMVTLTVHLYRKSREKRVEMSPIDHISYSEYALPIPIIKNVCLETSICPKEFECVLKKIATRKCKRAIYEKISADRELRKKVVKALLSQLYGTRVLDENEVIL